ncbi:MAG: CotH kinase family protein [Propionicimonas sp.]
MNRRFVAALVGIVSLGLLITPAAAGTAQAAPPPPPPITITPAAPYWDNQTISLKVDFPTTAFDGVTYGTAPYLSVYKGDTATGPWTRVAAGVKSSSLGVLTLSYDIGTAKHWVTVGNDPDKKNGVTGTFYNDGSSVFYAQAKEIDPNDPTGLGTLESTGSKSWRATFKGAALKSGQSVSLQVRTIETQMTHEVTSPTWKTIGTATQNSTGVANFSVSNPLEVEHSYRAVSGGVSSNTQVFSAPESAKVTRLPQVYFNTNEGATVNTRSRYFEGRFSLVQASNPAYPECATASGKLAAMKGRGNWSWSFAKKSFTVKLDSRTNLCGLGKSKKWALVANAYDRSLLRNSVANFIGSQLNLAWTPESRPVDVWFNGTYQGSYILVERIDADLHKNKPTDTVYDSKRIPYNPEGDNRTIAAADTPGFILEWDFRKGADKNVQIPGRGWLGIKDPENDYDSDSSASNPKGTNTRQGITGDQVTYIQNYVRACDAKLFSSNFAKDESDSRGWRSCIDKDSAVDYYIGMELMKVIDGNMWASVYMWKPKGGKLQFGPLWDFDLSSGSASRAGGTASTKGWYLRNVITTTAKQSTTTWFNRLNQDDTFRAAVRARWAVLNKEHKLRTDTMTFFDKSRTAIATSAGLNFGKWSVTQRMSGAQVIKGSWTKEAQYLRDWMWARMNWLDGTSW